MNQAVSKLNIVSAIFLVAGTCIGGGMLALPVTTGVSGFLPAAIIMILVWMAMTGSALLLLEASLWMKEGEHVISMASKLLGPFGKAVSWCLYLFICYASLVAYTAGGGMQISVALSNLVDFPISKEVGCLIFILVFGLIVYFGSKILGRANTLLFVAMLAAYFLLVGMGLPEVNIDLLQRQHWQTSLLAIPLLLTAFSFQTMVPSLAPYLKNHAKALRVSIILGTSIALFVYLLWQWIILGIVPATGPNSLHEALARGEPATQFLHEHVENLWVVPVAQYFAFFALVTSFLGIALGLFDFLSDGLHLKKVGWRKVLLALLIAIPTFFFATQFERIFLIALDASGGFGDTILNGMIPILMVWIGRYRMQLSSNFRIPGGKPLLICLMGFFIFSLCVEILVHTGHLLPIYNVREEYLK